MTVLGLVWLILLVLDLTRGLSPTLGMVVTGIWITFIADFVARFAIAPRKTTYLRRNRLTAISLAVPALRVLRVARAVRLLRFARFQRSLHLVHVAGSLSRARHSFGAVLGRRGFGYVMAVTVAVILSGAAGMYTLERHGPSEGFRTFGASLWWTAMVITTMASEYWPRTVEGRLLGFFLAVYAFAVFGYVTAVLATFLICQEALDSRAAR